VQQTAHSPPIVTPAFARGRPHTNAERQRMDANNPGWRRNHHHDTL